MSLPEDKERARERRRNYVAKHMNKVNRPSTHEDGKEYDRREAQELIEEELEEFYYE